MVSSVLPSASDSQVYVSVSALNGGYLTLPESLFVTNADPNKRSTVPSLSFLIQHPSSKSTIFDLGLKRDLSGYAAAQQAHIQNRQPTILSPDVSDSLRAGDLDPSGIDTVILSHVHWDHVGTPSDFVNAKFVVGSGTLDLLKNGGGPHYPAEIFNKDELPIDRTLELPPVRTEDEPKAVDSKKRTDHVWKQVGVFPAAVDFFGDGSVYIIDSPGHLTGHVNLLARIGSGKWVYLGGDCCHDPRILSGDSGVAMYEDGHGGTRSVHANTDIAKKTLGNIDLLLGEGRRGVLKGPIEVGKSGETVEVIVAHDGGWAQRNKARFWPGEI